MSTHLVVGAGRLGHTIAEALADRRDALSIVTDDVHRVDTLRADGFEVIPRDPTAASTFAALESAPETIVVADADPATNVAATRRVREAFPDALIVAYAGRDASPSVARELEEFANRVIDPGRSVVDRLLGLSGAASASARQLQRTLRSIEGHLAVVTHDNPDPDAIASAVALAHIATRAGCETSVCYYGAITHQENRAFVNVLEFDLVNLEAGEVPEDVDGVALVDHSRPGVNDGLPRETPIDVVIDHHPPREPVEARFVDLRSDVGATSTLLVEYLETLAVPFEESIATGLLFGIRVDTNDFRRGVSPADFEAGATLLPHADVEALRTIESPTISTDTLETVGRAIENRRHEGAVLMSGVGEIADRDALAQAADRLLDLQEVSATLVFGVIDRTIHVSARSRGTDIDLGETLRDAFGQIGSAGGHADMAGAQIELGVLETATEEESLDAIVGGIVTEQFLEALETGDHQLLADVYGPAGKVTDQYVEPEALEEE